MRQGKKKWRNACTKMKLAKGVLRNFPNAKAPDANIPLDKLEKVSYFSPTYSMERPLDRSLRRFFAPKPKSFSLESRRI